MNEKTVRWNARQWIWRLTRLVAMLLAAYWMMETGKYFVYQGF